MTRYYCKKCGVDSPGEICPSCGTHFSRIREDDGEFIEEMELFDGDEEDE